MFSLLAYLELITNSSEGFGVVSIHHPWEEFDSLMAGCHTYSAPISSKVEGFVSRMEDIGATQAGGLFRR